MDEQQLAEVYYVTYIKCHLYSQLMLFWLMAEKIRYDINLL